MSTTAREAIKSALRKILSTGATEEPSADQMADGLKALNKRMASLTVRGVRIAHQTLTLDDDIALDEAHIITIESQLAVDLAPEFGAAVDPQVAFEAKEGMKALKSDTSFAVSTPVDSALLRGMRHRGLRHG